MANEQQFCLRWNNHQSTLVSVFDTLLESGTLVDCTLAAEGQYLKAHKVVLSACSPYFELLLSQHYEKHPIIILKDVKFQELKAMMDYMYRGEVNISQDQLGALLKAAESLQIKGLSDSGGGGTEKDEPPEDKKPVTPARTPQSSSQSSGLTIEKRRPAPVDSTEDDSQPLPRGISSREGSSSPVPRKRKKHRRRSSAGEEVGESNALQDSHDQTSSSSDRSQPVPNVTQSLPASLANVPSSITVKPSSVETVDQKPVNAEAFPARTSVPQSQPSIPREPEVVQKVEPPTEVLLEPKAEYLDEDVNEDSVEDLTLDDDDDLDMSMDHAQPGPSHGGEGSSQGYTPWHVGDQSRDEVFMAAQEAVGAHRDSQGESQETEKSQVLGKQAVVNCQESGIGQTAPSISLQGHIVAAPAVSTSAVFVLPNFDPAQSLNSADPGAQTAHSMWQTNSSMLINTTEQVQSSLSLNSADPGAQTAHSTWQTNSSMLINTTEQVQSSLSLNSPGPSSQVTPGIWQNNSVLINTTEQVQPSLPQATSGVWQNSNMFINTTSPVQSSLAHSSVDSSPQGTPGVWQSNNSMLINTTSPVQSSLAHSSVDSSPQMTPSVWQSNSNMLIKTAHDPLKMIIPLSEAFNCTPHYTVPPKPKKPLAPRGKQHVLPKFKFILPKPLDQARTPDTAESCAQPAPNVMPNLQSPPDMKENPAVVFREFSPRKFEAIQLGHESVAAWQTETKTAESNVGGDPLQDQQGNRDMKCLVSLQDDHGSGVDVKPPVHVLPLQSCVSITETHFMKTDPHFMDIQPHVIKFESCAVKTEPHVENIEPDVIKIEPHIVKIEPEIPVVDISCEEDTPHKPEVYFDKEGGRSMLTGTGGMLLTRSMTRGGKYTQKTKRLSDPQSSRSNVKRTRGAHKVTPCISCPHCGKKFKSEANLKIHVDHVCLIKTHRK